MNENFVSFCIGCTACLGCTEESNNAFNQQLVLDFEERWLKFANGKEVLKVLSEDQVRERLRLHNHADAQLSAEECADALLSLKVEAYRDLLSKSNDVLVGEPEDWYGRDNERYEAWLLEEQEFWKEVEHDLLRPSDTPDWQALREQHRAKNVCKSLARQAQHELKEKHLQKQRHGQKPGHKYRGCRTSRRLNDSAEDIWLRRPLLGGCDAFCL